jgi:hypothetical protein
MFIIDPTQPMAIGAAHSSDLGVGVLNSDL